VSVRKFAFFAIGLAMGLGAWAISGSLGSHASNASTAFAQERSASTEPQYDSSGALLRPRNFETWVFVGSSTGLTYEPGMSNRGAGEFHDVYIRPESYREYARSGKFPEKTVLVLALYPPDEKVSPAKGGYFEGDLEGMAAAVKDHSHFSEGWAYFNFAEESGLRDKAEANPKETCFACHSQHAADDNVFVQFYPILRPIMKAHHSPSSR
jgi:Cytochrome P460